MPFKELHRAISCNNVNELSSLIQKGADVNIADQYGNTLLHHASFRGHDECVLLLLKAGADVNIADQHGEIPLYQASSNGRTECIWLLLEAGADVNIADQYGETPLYQASYNGRTDCIRILLDAGADVDISNSTGETPLYWASFKGYNGCVRLLLEAGADVNISNSKGETPLYWAGCHGEDECVRLLLEYGADINIASSNGETVLYRASCNGNHECVRLLLEYGVEIQTDTTFFQALNARVQGSLRELKAVKDAVRGALNANETLGEDAKIVVEKIANHRIFAPDQTLEDWQSEDFLSASIDCAILIYNSICENIRQHDESTKNFILENTHLLEESLDSNFKKWKISQLGLKKTLVNLAYICGDKVTGIMSLEKHGKEQVQKFIASITRDDDGNELITIPEYSVGEFALGEELMMVIRGRTSMPVAKHIAKFLPLDWALFSATQDDDATLGQEVLLAGQTVPHGDGMNHGPAVEA